MRTPRASAGAILCASLFATSPLCAQSVKVVGAEFQVNSYTPDFQRRAAVASEDNGDFVVVWQSAGDHDGSGLGVFGQRFTSAGSRLGTELQVNLHVTADQWAPSVAMDSDGDFVVVWHDGSGKDGSAYGVFGRRYASSGGAIGGEFQVNTFTSGFQSYPSVAMEGAGRFIVAWQSYLQDGFFFGIRGRSFDADGTPGLEFSVNATQVGNQILPAVAINDDGVGVIAWESTVSDTDFSGYGIVATFFNSLGSIQGQVAVNLYTADDQLAPAVAVTGDGRFIVAWRGGLNQDGEHFGVFARRFNVGGFGYEEIQVNHYTTAAQSDPSVAAAEDDNSFVVTWTGNQQDGSSDGIFARRFSSLGATLAPDFQINSYTPGREYRPSIAVSDNGRFVVAWEGTQYQDGSESAILARRGLALSKFDFDGDGTVGPLTDGLLLLRWMFGFSGAPLTTAAVGAACSRCTPVAVKSYIDEIAASSLSNLDIDDTGGPLEPLTDGLLVLRYLFGFTGDALVVGAVSPNCDRCTAGSIGLFIAPRVAL